MASPTSTTIKDKGAQPIHIVVVEDNPGDIYLLEKTLKDRELNYRLTTYADGEQAILALQKDDWTIPDLIIVDLNLPRRAGFDVLQTIRSKPSMVGVPIAILTSSVAKSDRHRIELTGGERYIQKPPMLEDFLAQVGDAIEELLGKN